MRRGATFDPTGAYRYHLWREWNSALPAITFVMLNPSTADEEQDDPTIRRCVGFARSWGFGRLEVVNLFAYRATSPREIFSVADPVGPDNARWLARGQSGHVLLAWGNHGRRATRPPLGSIAQKPLCLGLTRLGQPRHPLYVSGSARPQPLTAPEAHAHGHRPAEDPRRAYPTTPASRNSAIVAGL